MSDPVRTVFGYHLILVNEKRDEEIRASHILVKCGGSTGRIPSRKEALATARRNIEQENVRKVVRRVLGEAEVESSPEFAVLYQLTRKEDGRTKTIYVPRRASAEVSDWTGRWRQVRELLKEMSEFSRRQLCVAVDGTFCERKRGSGLSDIEKRRHALEARMPRLMASRCPAEWLRML